jgi:D-hexose-6-phosphate mutarotase
MESWQEKAGKMDDLGIEAWRTMVCVETAMHWTPALHTSQGQPYDDGWHHR